MKKIIWTLLTVIWIAFIFINSLKTGFASSEASGLLVNIADDILAIFNIVIKRDTLSFLIRKAAHFTEFSILGIFTYNLMKLFSFKYKIKVYKNVNISTYIIVLIICLIIAITDETIQFFVPGRANSIYDVLIDFSGSLFTVLIVVLINLKKIKSTLNKQ